MFHLELEISAGEETIRRRFKVAELGKIFVGRLNCDLLLESKMVSRKHLGFAIKAGKLVAGDMKSSHGTLHNGKPLTRAIVKRGDRFELGPYQIRVLEFRKAGEKAKAPKPRPEERQWSRSLITRLMRPFAITGIGVALVAGILVSGRFAHKNSQLAAQPYRPYQYQGDRNLSSVSDPTPVDLGHRPLVVEAGLGSP